MGKRKTKRTYLGSGAGSLRSGTGATAKKPKKSRPFIPTRKIFPTRPIPKKGRAFRIPKPIKRELRPITPKSPATGVDSVFKPLRKNRMPQTIRRRAKR